MRHPLPSGRRACLHNLRHEQVRPLDLDMRGNTPRQPVLHTLLPTLFRQVQQFSHLRRSTQGGDDLDVFLQSVHAAI